MKLSKFSFFIPISSKYYIIYNALNKSLMLVDEELKKSLENSNFSRIPDNILKNLIQNRIIIDDELDELAVYEYIFNKNKYRMGYANFLVLTTYDCNFACVYCYQGADKPHTYMDLDTAKGVVNYIENFSKDRFAKVIQVGLYGGEPLLNLKACNTILSGVFKMCEQEDIKFSAFLITNGSLMTPKVISRLKDYGLNGIQVTVDGTRDVHDRRRPFKGGKGSFDIIMSNVMKCVDLVPIILRINVDKDNLSNIPEFLDFLIEAGLRNRVELWIGFVRGLGHYCEAVQLTDESICKMRYELWKLAIKKGFKFLWHPVTLALCTAMRESSVIIDPKGILYKCWGLLGDEKFSIGSIYESKFKPIYYKYMTRNPLRNKKCRECYALPYCNGGCLYEAYIRTGNMFTMYCGSVQSKSGLEYMLKLYALTKYENILKTKGISINDII